MPNPPPELSQAFDGQIQVAAYGRSQKTGVFEVNFYPAAIDAKRRFVITNAPDEAKSFVSFTNPDGRYVIDVAELCRLIFPENASDSLIEQLKTAKTEKLWDLWLQCKSRIDKIPAWALESIGNACRERDEDELCELFMFLARKCVGERCVWQDSFERTATKVPRTALPDLSDCTPLNPDAVAGLLDKDGPLSKLLQGYEPRPGQLKMARAVTDAINNGQHLIVEAGTGIGKSLAYLLPAAIWAKLNDLPVVVSTNTKNLQTQLVEKDLPIALSVLNTTNNENFADGKPFRAAVIKGRSNYLCLRRFGQLIDNGLFNLSRQELRLFAQTLAWAVTSSDGDIDALSGGAALDRTFTEIITCGSDECLGRACRYHAQCFVQKARERSLSANLIIANHSLVFTETDAQKPIAIPRHAQIIFDEAHNLEEAATRHFTMEVSPRILTRVLRPILSKHGKKQSGVLSQLRTRVNNGAICPAQEAKRKMQEAIGAASSAIDTLKQNGFALFKSLFALLEKNEETKRYAFDIDPELNNNTPNDAWKNVHEARTAFDDAALLLKEKLLYIVALVEDDSKDQLNLVAGESAELANSVTRVEALQNDVETILSGCDAQYVFWIQRTHDALGLAKACAAPLNVGFFLNKSLYERKSSVILCSATLSVDGNFKYIASRLGLDLVVPERIAVCTAQSPFDYDRQCALIAPQYLPEPDARDYIPELSKMICMLAERYDGRLLCLFTSHEMLRSCARLAEPALTAKSIRLLVQGESGSRNKITQTFRGDDRCVLLGAQSFWEGVDVVGAALSCVIVARLPFSPPNDPIESARCERIKKDGGNAFTSYTIPTAALKLRQGFGRLIRCRDDFGSVIIADKRLTTQRYGARFCNSLPCRVQKCQNSEELLRLTMVNV